MAEDGPKMAPTWPKMSKISVFVLRTSNQIVDTIICVKGTESDTSNSMLPDGVKHMDATTGSTLECNAAAMKKYQTDQQCPQSKMSVFPFPFQIANSPWNSACNQCPMHITRTCYIASNANARVQSSRKALHKYIHAATVYMQSLTLTPVLRRRAVKHLEIPPFLLPLLFNAQNHII